MTGATRGLGKALDAAGGRAITVTDDLAEATEVETTVNWKALCYEQRPECGDTYA